DAFLRGVDLAIPEHVLNVAGSVGLDPLVAGAAAATVEVKDALKQATRRAGDLGVTGVPSFLVDGEVYWGDDCLDEAVNG
ncbi:MAG TPA: DsbA family protein, partial [Solirubrobacterales bacterium]|nr:DsbA family protein [Solirubrobacterales bacterium]